MRHMPAPARERKSAVTLRGYASLFGAPDQIGDVVRAGAFRSAKTPLPMLVAHDPRLAAGAWSAAREDPRGLWVEGALDPSLPAARLAEKLLAEGLDGLSIGFRARRFRPLGRGRELIEIELIEVSLVDAPMLLGARLAGRS